MPPLDISKDEVEQLKAEIPELPQARRERFEKEYKLSEKNIEILINFKNLADFFEHTVSELMSWLGLGEDQDRY